MIPELQEWADKLDVRIVECDLRWGVPRNTNFKTTIGMMMDELDRCVDTSDAQPFMVCLLGERYVRKKNKYFICYFYFRGYQQITFLLTRCSHYFFLKLKNEATKSQRCNVYGTSLPTTEDNSPPILMQEVFEGFSVFR